MKNLSKLIFVSILVIQCNMHLISQETGQKMRVLNTDGAWCWFSSPRAIYRHAGPTTILTGWVKSDGSIEAAELNPATGTVKTQLLAPQLEKDDHANPSFVELPDGKAMVCYVKHFDEILRYHLTPDQSAGPLFGPVVYADPFSEEELQKFPLKRLTYTNPFVLKSEKNRLYCFGRWTGFKPNIMWSDDGGNTFSTSRVMITNYPFDSENRPYVNYHSDGDSKIHFVFTDGHPRNEPLNSVYYACYEDHSFWRADGTKICDIKDLPFEPKDASLVYQATEVSGKSWVYDIASDKKGNPVILYARYPDDSTHLYHYVTYDGKRWTDRPICNSGKWFPQTPQGTVEREPNYSGGLTVHPLKTNVVYISRQVNGIFEIQKCTTDNRGENWQFSAVTENSAHDNVRPFFPRNIKDGDPDILLWMRNSKYVHYTSFDSEIVYLLKGEEE